MANVAKLVKDNSVFEARNETDTIRLWENYRDQALLWRSLTLLQVPTTLCAIVFALIMWHTRSITLNVPRQPLPGTYNIDEIPDEIFIEQANSFLNLIATYQSAVARPQFVKAREMVAGPMLTQFDTEMMNAELKAIENTSRTQVFFVDPTRTRIERKGNEITVLLQGERVKAVAGKELPTIRTQYMISMQTLPRNTLNQYGIVVTRLSSEQVSRDS